MSADAVFYIVRIDNKRYILIFFYKKSQNIVDKFREIVYSERKYERTHILKNTKDNALKVVIYILFLECVFYC